MSSSRDSLPGYRCSQEDRGCRCHPRGRSEDDREQAKCLRHAREGDTHPTGPSRCHQEDSDADGETESDDEEVAVDGATGYKHKLFVSICQRKLVHSTLIISPQKWDL
jgi:hypothetical protein